MNIDMDPANTPSNTATTLGSREPCARIDENDVLDADEDSAADTVSVDVTVTNIPAANPMIGFSYDLTYDETALTVQTANHGFLLLATPGGSPFNASDPVPDLDGNGDWTGSSIDISETAPESGSGVLSRIAVSSDVGTPGAYALVLRAAGIVDPNNDAIAPNNAVDTDADNLPDTVAENPLTTIAINQACGGAAVASLADYVARLYSAIAYLSRLGR